MLAGMSFFSLLGRPISVLNRLGQPEPFGIPQRFGSQFPRVRPEEQPDPGDLSDVLHIHPHHERPAEGHLDD